MKKIIPFVLLVFFMFWAYQEYEKNESVGPLLKSENKSITLLKQKISTLPVLARVEVRNYIKDENHKYQADVTLIKKMKIKLDPHSKVYLELNLFVNETDDNAPLVAQFMLFDVNSQNLIEEDNLNLN